MNYIFGIELINIAIEFSNEIGKHIFSILSEYPLPKLLINLIILLFRKVLSLYEQILSQ
jgi:hypothetical protein